MPSAQWQTTLQDADSAAERRNAVNRAGDRVVVAVALENDSLPGPFRMDGQVAPTRGGWPSI